MSIQPVAMICPQNKWGIKCPYTMTPEAICVHNTANDASARNEITYMNSNNNQVSYHFAIDDGEVVQGLPLNRNGWHAGDGGTGKGNRTTIGIEICYSKSGGERFDKAEKLAAKFIAQLLDERDWGIDKVTKHQDYSGKYCPHRTLDYGWSRFLDMVSAELKSVSLPTITWSSIPKTTFVTINNTALYDVQTMEKVRHYGIGVTMEFVEETTVGNTTYYRTEYSKGAGVNNGIPAGDVTEYQKIEETIRWTLLDEPISKIALRDCVLIDLKNGDIKKAFELGERIDNIVDCTEIDGERYYRTQYSRDQKKSYGIDSYQLGDVEEPITTPSEIEPEGDVDLEPVTPTPDDGSKPESVTVATTFLNAVIDLLKKLFKKG